MTTLETDLRKVQKLLTLILAERPGVLTIGVLRGLRRHGDRCPPRRLYSVG